VKEPQPAYHGFVFKRRQKGSEEVGGLAPTSVEVHRNDVAAMEVLVDRREWEM